MIEMDLAFAGLIEHPLDAWGLCSSCATSPRVGSRHVDMSDLMIGDGKGLMRRDRDVRRPVPHAPDQPARRSTRLTRTGRETAVTPYSDSTTIAAPARARADDELAADRIHGRHVASNAGEAGAESLQVIIEMRKIDERERRSDDRIRESRVGDPARGLDVGGGPPEMEERELTQLRCSASRTPQDACRHR